MHYELASMSEESSISAMDRMGEFLFDNAQTLNSGMYVDLCDHLNAVYDQIQIEKECANHFMSIRAVSSMPSSLNILPLRKFVKHRAFMPELVEFKMLELQKIGNYRLRSALATAWKEEVVKSVLDDYAASHTELHMKVQWGVEALLKMKIGMLRLVTRRLDDLQFTPHMVFFFDTTHVPSARTLPVRMPKLAACLSLEPRLLRWVLGMEEHEPWPTTREIVGPVTASSTALRNALIEFSNAFGGDDPLINNPCTCSSCKNNGLIELVDDGQQQFNTDVFETLFRPRVRFHGYDTMGELGNIRMGRRSMLAMKRAVKQANSCRACNSIGKRIAHRRQTTSLHGRDK